MRNKFEICQIENEIIKYQIKVSSHRIRMIQKQITAYYEINFMKTIMKTI